MLTEYDIPVPKLLERDIEKQYLVKEFIDGKLASEMIADDCIDSHILEKLFEISNKISEAGFNIDYFPNNFVVKDDDLFYIDYEINEYDDKWNFENWGLFYWLNSAGFRKFLKTGDAKYINIDLEKGIPIKKPFQKMADQLIKQYVINFQ